MKLVNEKLDHFDGFFIRDQQAQRHIGWLTFYGDKVG